MSGWEPVVPAGQAHIYDDWHVAPAVRVGDLLLCSGVLGLAGDGSVPPEPTAQYEQLFANLGDLLRDAGAGLGDIVDIVSFHVDLPNQIGPFGAVKDRHVGPPYPAWTAVEVAGVGAGAYPGLLAEVKITAVLR